MTVAGSAGRQTDPVAAAKTWQRVQRASSRLSTTTVQAMEELPWFAALPARQRADVGLVVQAGIAAFTDWLRDSANGPVPAPEVFAVAPRELARAITLKQTVQLIRVVVGVMEQQVPALAAPGQEAELAEAVLRYSREIAFAAADVYAAAAEARGAWDARVEAGVVEALVRGPVGELTLSRATSLGWARPAWVTALAASAPRDPTESGVEELRAVARHHDLSLLVGEAAGGLLIVVGGRGAIAPVVAALVAGVPAGPVVVGPVVPELAAAPGCVAEALAGLAAVAAWPQAPRPVESAELLAERAVLGDPAARHRLLEEVHEPLVRAGGDLLATAAAYLEGGSSVEGTGRALFLHPNTVRYRLRKVSEAIGRDLTSPRDAQMVRLALVLGRTTPL